MRFADYYWGLLFLLIPLAWHLKSKQKFPTMPHPDIFIHLKNRGQLVKMKILIQRIMRVAAISILILAIMRPQRTSISDKMNRYGVDIMVCFDVSGSMAAEDFKPNRIDAAKKVLVDFIRKRSNDRMGLIVFGSQSYIQCPLTGDHNTLLYFIDNIYLGIAEDGTAIGMALANAARRLKDSQAKTKLILLITDGDNNAGAIDPETAARLAATYNIKIYVIGIGSPEGAPIPVGRDPFGRKVYARNPDGSLFLTKLNAEGLKKISQTTGGDYYIASDEGALVEIFSKIDKMEKTKFESRQPRIYDEKFRNLIILALTILLAEYLIVKFYIKPFPSQML